MTTERIDWLIDWKELDAHAFLIGIEINDTGW